ncbi:hypothetical protein RYZ26_14790 [Terasakiella sp. A23]|uniref:hypothetical protein n=1 Tax=Terasakiella sp. FCG-A23 TaxID=3080561 RepID=UPI002954FC46|nr:hypothetical protein [Terasakiella sp. A23]MDV7340871.1 hypothetical protein [Terasakiella sp. A23]
MRRYPTPAPYKLISDMARDLIWMAAAQEGPESWHQRHHHVRLFAQNLYGDCEEADLLGAMMSLQEDRV